MSTSEQVGNNKEGVGGFGDNPQNINKGGRPKNQQSISYWMKQFLNMSQEEFKEWDENGKPMAAILARTAVINSKVELPERKEVADRTEGRAKQTIEHGGEVIENVRVRIIKDATESGSNGSISEELPK